MKFNLVLIIALALMAIASCTAPATPPVNTQPPISPPDSSQAYAELSVHFIDVGQGDSILIDSGTTEILIDGGVASQSQKLVPYLQKYVDGSLEVMVATHPHADHIGGLCTVLDNFVVDDVWYNGESCTSATCNKFVSAAEAETPNIHEAKRGDQILVGQLSLNVLNPARPFLDSTNNRSIVLILHYGSVDFLFEGDAEKEAESSMLAAGLIPDVEILKVGHHGSRTASSEQFLQACKPEVAIYMAKIGNSFGHPHQETIEALTKVGVSVYGTDLCGTIIITTDGKSYSVPLDKQCKPRAPPMVTPIPANFVVTNLSISPDDVKPGKPVTISATVTNSGGSPGDYIAILNINSSEVETKSVVLNAGESQVVSFTVVKASTGNYVVDIGGLAGTFTVTDTTPKPPSDCTCYSYTLKGYIPCEQATAICRDGTCSISKSRSGTCSHHGGVRQWVNRPPN